MATTPLPHPPADPDGSLLHRTLDDAVDAVLVLDRQLVIAYANASAAAVLGRRADELVGKQWEAAGLGNQSPRFKEEAAAVLQTGACVRAEGVVSMEGRDRVFEYTVTPVRGEDGAVEGVAFMGRDVTDRKLDEQHATQLRSLTHRLAASMSREEVATVVVGQLHEYLGAGASAAYFTSAADPRLRLVASRNVPPAALHEASVLDLDRPIPVAAAARQQQPIWQETPAQLASEFPAALSTQDAASVQAGCAVPLVFEGELLGVIGLSFTRPTPFPPNTRRFLQTVAAECSQALVRAQLLERERRAKDHAAFLAEATSLMSSSLDVDEVLGRLARLTVPRFADWCSIYVPEGESYREVAAAHVDPARMAQAEELRRRFPPDPRHPGVLMQVMRTGQPLMVPHITDQMLAASARDEEHLKLLREVGMRATMMLPISRSGKVFGVIALVWSESGRTYDRFDQEVISDLAGRAALALENAELYREVTSAVELRDDFLAMAGHELRTPLAALLIKVQSLERVARRDPALAPIRDRLERTARSALRLDKLVSQLLDVSRIAAGRLGFTLEVMDLTELVSEVVDRFREVAATAGSELRIRAVGPVQGSWDRARLDQVVTNLLSNALKYGGGSPVDLEVRAADGGAVLTVQDRGIGIAEEERGRLFQRFERAVTSREYGGLGLGLWISRQIVEGLGGTIEVQSRPSEGSTFTVWLPASPLQ